MHYGFKKSVYNIIIKEIEPKTKKATYKVAFYYSKENDFKLRLVLYQLL